jgi:hypothetical protein
LFINNSQVPLMNVWILVVLAFLGGTWFGTTRLGVWYALYKLGQAESRDRHRRIRG